MNDLIAYELGELDAESQARLFQSMINSGIVWKMYVSYGRAAMTAIEAGACMLGIEAGMDFWGNCVPSRKQVMAGTKGSREYVVERHGEEWAKMLDAVE